MSLVGQYNLVQGGQHIEGQGQGRIWEEWVWGPVEGWGGGKAGALYNEVQCILGNGHMGPHLCEQTDRTENITFPQLRWRAVNIDVNYNTDPCILMM